MRVDSIGNAGTLRVVKRMSNRISTELANSTELTVDWGEGNFRARSR